MYEEIPQGRISRRRFLKTSAVALAASGLPLGSLAAQSPYVRYSMTSTQGKAMLVSYRKAIRAMMALPATDPQNWYRNALIHTLDCPHGNWWFLPWHRGFIGWFERTCRKLSGDPNFALPFWDWTADPFVPADFFGADDILDVTSPSYIKTFAEFESKYKAPLQTFYSGLTSGQKSQLATRPGGECAGFNTVDELFVNCKTYFYEGAAARCLTKAAPSFAAPPAACVTGCNGTPQAVSAETVGAALEPATFVPFGSYPAPYHNTPNVHFGVLENQPHNLVHNCTGGFMSDFLSTVDPLFFMHHSNIDRLWNIWTRKQQAAGQPTLPVGCEFDAWSKEPFLFYVDGDGRPLTSGQAGEYAEIGQFNYTYGPGSFEEVGRSARKKQSRVFGSPAEMAGDLVMAAATEEGTELFVRIEVDTSGHAHDKVFHVLLDPPAGADPTDTKGPHHVATLAFFGTMHHHGTASFLVPLTGALRKVNKLGLLKAAAPLRIVVVTEEGHGKSRSAPQVPAQVELMLVR